MPSTPMPRPSHLVVALAILTALGGCASAFVPDELAEPAAGLPAAYVWAIYDAAVFEADEVRPLPSITADSLTVVSWVPTPYAAAYPVGADTSYGRELWVTVAPQVQEACRGFDPAPAALRLRLQQYLGLKPDASRESFFATLRVARTDLFRACTDPSLETTACTEAVPAGVSDAHLAWVAGQMLASYRVSAEPDGTGYPWTRMGYTYDWNPDSPEAGAFEYVVPPGKPVRILAATPTAAYCAR